MKVVSGQSSLANKNAAAKNTVRKRIVVWLLATFLLTTVSLGQAQQPAKIPLIGFLSGAPLSSIQSRVDAFRQGLRDHGYAEGKTVAIEWRSAEGKSERLRFFADELVDLKVDVIVVAGGEPVAQAAKQATHAIPIVMTNAFDPVGSGLVASLARPDGNITGLSTNPGPQIYGKQLELLKESKTQAHRYPFESRQSLQRPGHTRDRGDGSKARSVTSISRGA